MTALRQVWLVAALLTVLSLLVQMNVPGTIHESEDIWRAKYELHVNSDAFTVRPFTTRTMGYLHDWFDVSFRTSFFVLQFLLMFLSGPAFAYYLSKLGFSSSQRLTGMVVYYLSLPIFLAHLEPHHIWSDFWVFLMVPLSFGLVIERKLARAMLTMAWALLAREITVLFLPIWFLLIHDTQPRRKREIAATMVFLVLLLLFSFRFFLTGANSGNVNFKLFFNFENGLRTNDTLFSVFASLGFLWVTGLWVAIKGKARRAPFFNILRIGALFTVLGYVCSTLLVAQARETRLLFPPYMFLIPLTLLYVEDRRPQIKELYSGQRRLLSIVFWVAILAASGAVATALLPTFEYRSWHDGNRAYLALHITILVGFVILEVKNKRSGRQDQVLAN